MSCTFDGLFLKVNAELAAITKRFEYFERSVVMSLVRPSQKYSCEGSPLRFPRGRIAIEGWEEDVRGGLSWLGVVSGIRPQLNQTAMSAIRAMAAAPIHG